MTQTISSSTSGIDRKSLKKPDNFTVWVKKGFEPVLKNKKLLVASLIAIVLIVTIGFWYSHYLEQKEIAANNSLFEAQLTLGEEVSQIIKSRTPKDKPKKADPNAVDESLKFSYEKLDVQQTYVKSFPLLEAVAQNHPGTRASFQAQYLMGQLFYQHQNYEGALAHFELAIKDAPSEIDRTFVHYAKAFALESLGKHAEAISSLRSAINSFTNNNDSLKSDILLAIARNHTALGENEKAKPIYDEILKEFPETENAKKAELLRSQL